MIEAQVPIVPITVDGARALMETVRGTGIVIGCVARTEMDLRPVWGGNRNLTVAALLLACLL